MRVVATSSVPQVARDLFAPIGEILVLGVDGDAALLAEAEVLVVRGGRVDAGMLASASSLRAVARTGAGYDNIDLEAATRLGIPVVYAPGSGVRAVAEGAFALIVAAAKRLGELEQVVRSGTWESRYEPVGKDLHGSMLGVVGLGRIGLEVARLGHAVGMQVIAFDPALASPPAHAALPVGLRGSLQEVVGDADVVTLHCALTPQTHGMVNRALLARCKPGAVFVNAARGPMVESEDTLLEALDAGHLSAVGLDVFPTEPPDQTHPLYRDPRVICTPHSVSLTDSWNRSVFGVLATAVQDLLHGAVPEVVLNPEALGVK
jgi:phosphoglycerate dehydrogenase-like enzyme